MNNKEKISQGLASIHSLVQQLQREGTVADWVTETFTKEILDVLALLEEQPMEEKGALTEEEIERMQDADEMKSRAWDVAEKLSSSTHAIRAASRAYRIGYGDALRHARDHGLLSSDRGRDGDHLGGVGRSGAEPPSGSPLVSPRDGEDTASIPNALAHSTCDAQGWISVADRLPEHRVPVLCKIQWSDDLFIAYRRPRPAKGKPDHWYAPMPDEGFIAGDAYYEGGVDERYSKVTH